MHVNCERSLNHLLSLLLTLEIELLLHLFAGKDLGGGGGGGNGAGCFVRFFEWESPLGWSYKVLMKDQFN